MRITFPGSQLPDASLSGHDSETLHSIASICSGGLPFRLCYDEPRFRYPLAASFTSRGPAAQRF